MREAVVVAGAPAEGVDQRPERDGAVHAAARDHDVCARRERRGDREGAEVGVCAHDLLREWCAREHFLGLCGAQRLDLRHEVVAEHGGDLQVHAFGLRRRDERRAAGRGVDAAGIRDHLDAACLDLFHQRAHGADEVGRVALRRVFGLGAAEQRHGDFGEVVEHQHVDVAVLDELGRGKLGVAPEARGAAYAQGGFAHVCLR